VANNRFANQDDEMLRSIRLPLQPRLHETDRVRDFMAERNVESSIEEAPCTLLGHAVPHGRL